MGLRGILGTIICNCQQFKHPPKGGVGCNNHLKAEPHNNLERDLRLANGNYRHGPNNQDANPTLSQVWQKGNSSTDSSKGRGGEGKCDPTKILNKCYKKPTLNIEKNVKERCRETLE